MVPPKTGHTRHLTEDETLERIRRILGRGSHASGLDDDAAVVEVPGGGALVVSVDSVVDGVHVDLAFCRPADVGWKALMGALSDLAAMGARPVGALVALCVPEGAGGGEVTLGVMEGVAEASVASGCPVVGGDVSSGTTLMVSVTVMGTVDGGVPVPRAGARGGEAVLVSGPCGGSAAGLRELRAGRDGGPAAAYLRPVARLAEGEVARSAGVHAMIDVSDGLALDLHRLADASGVGFELEADAVPVAAGATWADALSGGEDYELVMTVDENEVGAFRERFVEEGLRPPVRIGVTTGDPGIRTLGGVALDRLGWQHRVG